MVLINVTTPFNFTDASGNRQVFDAGITEVDEATAAHWYVAAHSEPVPVVEGEAPKRGRKPRKSADDQITADQVAAMSAGEQQSAELAEALRIAAEQA